MGKTTPRAVGPWPAPIPIGDARAAVWLDGTIASALIAHWFTQAGARWVALVDQHRPARARAAAEAVARHLGADVQLVDPEGPVSAPLGWARAAHAAIAADARWLVLPVTGDDLEPPLPIRLHAAESALTAHGLTGLWAPLLGWDPVALGRLALALGVRFEDTWDCVTEPACGRCPGCLERARLFKQLGIEDPVA
jgi:7-cyano-7-deazaguanine synthase in queuosine biosynthesis